MSGDREHLEQKAVVQYVALRHPTLREHLTAVPNGGHRDRRVAAKLKAEGVTAGYPDLLIDLPRGPWHGLRIEMKAPGGVTPSGKRQAGRPTAEQKAWLARLSAAGYRAVVCVGAREAIAEIESYWALGPYRPPEAA